VGFEVIGSRERAQWLDAHREPHDPGARRDYFERFPLRLQNWLDAGMGSCILSRPEPKRIVENALRHFAGQRYGLDLFVVAPNHVHALVTPLAEYGLSSILHSWKSFTAHEIMKWNIQRTSGPSGSGVSPLNNIQSRDGSATPNNIQSQDRSATLSSTIWQKESFDHIVRSPDSLERFRHYIHGHMKGPGR
jgi:REP element-mobilizing transposase RayT